MYTNCFTLRRIIYVEVITINCTKISGASQQKKVLQRSPKQLKELGTSCGVYS